MEYRSYFLAAYSLLFLTLLCSSQDTDNTTLLPVDNTTATFEQSTIHVLAVTSGLETGCPSDVFGRLRACTRQSGVLAGALRSMVHPNATFAFCGLEQNVTMACLQNNLDLCADNPMRRALLTLHVNIQTMQDDLQYFCLNQQVLNVEKNCTNYQEASRCSQRDVAKLQDSLTLMDQLKPILDARCLYNDDLLQCVTATMGPSCDRTRQLYTRLLHAIRYPYCDLPEVDQYANLHHALSLPEQKSDTAGPPTGGEKGQSGTGNGAGSFGGIENNCFSRFASQLGIALLTFVVGWYGKL